MKIQLIHTVEADGEWYKVLKDGWPMKSFLVTGCTPDKSLNLAREYYTNLYERCQIKSTVLLEDKIPD